MGRLLIPAPAIKIMNTRKADIEELNRDRQIASPYWQKKIDKAGSKICKESRKIAHMREALVRATREGNNAEIRDIHEFVKTHKDYQNE